MKGKSARLRASRMRLLMTISDCGPVPRNHSPLLFARSFSSTVFYPTIWNQSAYRPQLIQPDWPVQYGRCLVRRVACRARHTIDTIEATDRAPSGTVVGDCDSRPAWRPGDTTICALREVGSGCAGRVVKLQEPLAIAPRSCSGTCNRATCSSWPKSSHTTVYCQAVRLYRSILSPAT